MMKRVSNAWDCDPTKIFSKQFLALDPRLEQLHENAIFRLLWLRGRPRLNMPQLLGSQVILYLTLVPAVYFFAPPGTYRAGLAVWVFAAISVGFSVYYKEQTSSPGGILRENFMDLLVTPLKAEDYAFAWWGFYHFNPYLRIAQFAQTLMYLSIGSVCWFYPNFVPAMIGAVTGLFIRGDLVFPLKKHPTMSLLYAVNSISGPLSGARGKIYYPSTVGLNIPNNYERVPPLLIRILGIRSDVESKGERDHFGFDGRIEYMIRLWREYLAIWHECESPEQQKEWLERLCVAS